MGQNDTFGTKTLKTVSFVSYLSHLDELNYFCDILKTVSK